MINSNPKETNNNKGNLCKVHYQLGDKNDLKLQQETKLNAGEQMCVTLAWSNASLNPLLSNLHQHLSEQSFFGVTSGFQFVCVTWCKSCDLTDCCVSSAWLIQDFQDVKVLTMISFGEVSNPLDFSICSEGCDQHALTGNTHHHVLHFWPVS